MSPERPPEEFCSEATETAEALGKSLLALEGAAAPEPDLLNAVFRQAHSLKGLAATFGQQRMADLSICPLTCGFIARRLASFCAGERHHPEQRRNNG